MMQNPPSPLLTRRASLGVLATFVTG